MASKIKVDEIAGSTGSTVTIPTGQTLTLTDGLAVASLPVVTVAKGGTNIASFAAGDLLYATGSTTLAKLPKGAAEKVLSINSGATAPEWTDVDLTVLPTISVAKGGTNLTSFTAGDFLYATGSTTLAKLTASGHGSKTLKMNSGATAPEWVTVAAASADVVKVVSGAFTTNAYIDLQGCFTGTYKFYKLFMGGYSTSTTSYSEIGFLNVSDAAITDTYYVRTIHQYGSPFTGGTNFGGSVQNDQQGFRMGNTWNQNGPQGQTLEMFFYDPNNSDQPQQVHGILTSTDATPYVSCNLTHGYCNTTTAKHGLRLGTSSGTWLAKGHYALYGYKI